MLRFPENAEIFHFVQVKKRKSHKHKDRVDCTPIRTVLPFAMVAECTSQDDSFKMVVDDDKVKADQYQALHRWRERVDLADLVQLHFVVFIGKFQIDDLRLYSWHKEIRLVFAHWIEDKEERENLLVFSVRFNKFIEGMRDRVDHEKIVSDLDQQKGMLSITVPMLW